MIEKDICKVWSNLCKIDFNFFDSETQEKSTKSIEEVAKVLLSGKDKKVVVNGGHFIPDGENYDLVGENPQKTWETACLLVKYLKEKEISAKLSMLLNDLPITVKQREQLAYSLPLPYLQKMNQNNLTKEDLISYSLRPGKIYAEKQLSNRVSYLVRRTKHMADYPKLDSHCVSAIIGYLRDVKKQGANIAVWILPKCSTENFFDAINIFDQAEGGLRHIAYFRTDNCYL